MKKTYSHLDQLLIYRNILQDEIVQEVCEFLTGTRNNLPFGLFYKLIQKSEQLELSGNILRSYIIHLIAMDENTFSRVAEKTDGHIGDSLRQAVIHDTTILRKFINQDLVSLSSAELPINYYVPTSRNRKNYLETLQPYFLSNQETHSHEEVVDKLIEHYVSYGYGEFVNHTAFRWHKDTGLEGIIHCDPIRLTDLIGYDRQKNALIKNTEAFLTGKPACNVLLAGDRGTGKSSSVKALVNHYSPQGLRLVELAKHDLPYFHDIIKILRNIGKKFIIFLDDLSFEEFEIEYKHLKSVMEGGIESRPNNVLIYATSNRMHLIRENWNDRNEKNGDVHSFDTVNEKLSLSDRFGITLTYASPSQADYLKIIEELALKNNIIIPLDILTPQALQWERAHAGRSGRTAQNFIMHLLGNAK